MPSRSYSLACRAVRDAPCVDALYLGTRKAGGPAHFRRGVRIARRSRLGRFPIEETFHVLHRDAPVAPAPLQFLRGQRMIIE
jgi:hypothetical protein